METLNYPVERIDVSMEKVVNKLNSPVPVLPDGQTSKLEEFDLASKSTKELRGQVRHRLP